MGPRFLSVDCQPGSNLGLVTNHPVDIALDDLQALLDRIGAQDGWVSVPQLDQLFHKKR